MPGNEMLSIVPTNVSTRVVVVVDMRPVGQEHVKLKLEGLMKKQRDKVKTTTTPTTIIKHRHTDIHHTTALMEIMMLQRKEEKIS